MKNLLLLFMAMIALVFTSCNKDEETVLNPVQKIKVFMSALAKENTLKSASTSSSNEATEIQNGDTADVYQLVNINAILTAENEYGNKADGAWSFKMIEGDNLYERFDDGSSYYAEQSIISIKMQTLGLYVATFIPKFGDSFVMYIRNTGIPGEVGDVFKNDYSFRLERAMFNYNSYPNKKGFTFFIKSTFREFDNSIYDPSLENNYFVIIDCGGKSKMIVNDLPINGLQKLLLKKCKYSLNYYYTSIISEVTPPKNETGIYKLIFGMGNFGVNHSIFQSMFKSDWYKDGVIVFKTF